MNALTRKPDPDSAMAGWNRGPAIDEWTSIPTPEKIAFEYELAGPVRRLWAWLIDLVLVQVGYWSLVALIVFLGTLALGGLQWDFGSELSELLGGIVLAAVLMGAFAVNWFYGAWMEARYNGQSLGKRWTNLRVLSSDGGAISSGQALLRNFLRYADLLPFIPITFFLPESASGESAGSPLGFPAMFVGLTAMLVFPGFRRVGDLVAGTMVVSEQYGALPESIRFEDPRVEMLAGLLPRSFVPGRSLSIALATYVDRRRKLAPERREEISAHLGTPLLAKLGLPADTNHDLLLCSLYYRTFVGDGSSARMRKKRAGP